MRRQLKPFVTEYRGGLRRGKDAAIAAEPATEQPRSRAFEEAQRMFQPDSGEDSYEAALRAADALFARAPQQAPAETAHATPGPGAISDEPPVEPTRHDDRSTAGHAHATLDAGETWAGETWAGRSSVDEPTVPLSPGTSLPKATGAAPPRRILQAIEPPEENRFAALEAERAPKRRGRKPGSKNKPKVVIGDDWPAAAPLRAAKSPSAANGNGARHAFGGFAFDASLDDEVLDDEILAGESLDEAGPAVSSSDGGGSAIDDPSAESQPRGRNDKFTRKRVGLRPGERWKRRLPKAAW